MQRKLTLGLATGLVATLLTMTSSASAQNSATDDIAKYREMIADGNPSELYEAAGEDLWKKPAGPKNATLEKCNLGLGPGVVKGAAAQLPRYFKDTNKVQDLESRLMTCMQVLQGRDPQLMIDAPFQNGPKKDMEAIVAYVVTQSKGDKIKVSAAHPKEKEMYDLGKRAFFFQGGVQWTSHAHLAIPRMESVFAYKIYQILQSKKELRWAGVTGLHTEFPVDSFGQCSNV